MQDRAPTKPNRYAVYDDDHNFLRYEYHERADEPTQEGTPLTKATLLSDTTAAQLGLSGDPTVDDALGKLSAAALIQKSGGEPIYAEVSIGSLAVGTVIKIIENGEYENYYIAQHGYPVNGNGRTLVRRQSNVKEFYGTANKNGSYDRSDADVWLNSTFLDRFSSKISDSITEVNIPCVNSYYDQTVGTIYRKSFLQSATEAGKSGSFVEGSKLALYTGTGINPYTTDTQLTRSISNSSSSSIWYFYNTSDWGNGSATGRLLPFFTLPSTLRVYSDGTTAYEEQAYTASLYAAATSTGEVIGGFTAIEAGSYVGTGTYGSANKNSLTFSFAPRLVILYAFYGNGGVQSTMDTYSVSYMSADILNNHSGANCTGFTAHTNNPSYGSKSTDGKTFMWYNAQNADLQYNTSYYTYYYIAIG